MKQLFLIRHGLPHEGHHLFPGDPPLHPEGIRHARRLATAMAKLNIDRIVSSPQQRALDTAIPLASKLQKELQVIDGLAEIDQGVERYRSLETFRAEEPHRWSEFVASPERFFGKDPDAFRATVIASFQEILRAPDSQSIAVFSHGMTIKTLLSAVLGLSATNYAKFSLAHCSVTRLSGTDVHSLRIDSVNESLCMPVAQKVRKP
jgi:broad specificity phosphatase PhoE